MTQTQHPSGWGAPGGDRWSRRPRRSTTDRKVAGVAGGLGRAINVDPVLIRVAFVVLTIFGGLGVPLYLLAWLFLPADGDQVSAAESLLGRGRSSVPPVLAVGLGIGTLIAIGWTFSWGLPFFPLMIGAVVVVAVLSAKHRGRNCAGPGGRPDGSADAAAWEQRAQRWSDQAERWGEHAGDWVNRQPWAGGSSAAPMSGSTTSSTQAPDAGPEPTSPFDRPAFWDVEPPVQSRPTDATAADDPTGARKPPEWDPLGVAPFAWDLPDPAPAPTPPPPPAARRTGGRAVTRVTLGLALLAGGLATLGNFAGWWTLSWAAVAATALVVIAAGLFVGALRGRGHGLIGPGIFLSLVTVALAITGIDGRASYGQQTWQPVTASSVQPEYVLNGGQGVLDLTHLAIPAGDTVSTEVEVRAGQARVIVPRDATVDVTCTANAGDVDCLGQRDSGLRSELTASNQGSSDEGSIDLTVHVGAGQAEVVYG